MMMRQNGMRFTRNTGSFAATAILMSALVGLCGAAALRDASAGELAIGAAGPAFSLKGTDGAMHSLDQTRGGKGTAVIFTCNECPFAKGYEDRLIGLAKEFGPKGIGFIAINANDPKVQPGDGFEFMVKRAQEKGFPYPYVIDETQATAAAYGAKVTPHIFLLDAEGKLAYRGRIDDSLDLLKVKKADFRAALNALVTGKKVPDTDTKAFGCGVKWSKKSD